MSELNTVPADAPPSPFARLRGGFHSIFRHVLDMAPPPLCPSCRAPHGDGLCATCWSKLATVDTRALLRAGAAHVDMLVFPRVVAPVRTPI